MTSLGSHEKILTVEMTSIIYLSKTDGQTQCGYRAVKTEQGETSMLTEEKTYHQVQRERIEQQKREREEKACRSNRLIPVWVGRNPKKPIAWISTTYFDETTGTIRPQLVAKEMPHEEVITAFTRRKSTDPYPINPKGLVTGLYRDGV